MAHGVQSLDLDQWINAVPDFPKPGILFRDITPLLADPMALNECLNQLQNRVEKLSPTCIVGIESRGFLFGVPLSLRLNVPFIPARKPGKLPRDTHTVSYSLEYGEDTLHIHKGDIPKGARVLLVDDLLATGGTAAACVKLIEASLAKPVGCAFVIELDGLDGRERLPNIDVISLLNYPA